MQKRKNEARRRFSVHSPSWHSFGVRLWEWADCDYIQLFDGAGRSKVFAIPTRLTDRPTILMRDAHTTFDRTLQTRTECKVRKARSDRTRMADLWIMHARLERWLWIAFVWKNESWENWNWPEKNANDNFDGRTQLEFTKQWMLQNKYMVMSQASNCVKLTGGLETYTTVEAGSCRLVSIHCSKNRCGAAMDKINNT